VDEGGGSDAVIDAETDQLFIVSVLERITEETNTNLQLAIMVIVFNGTRMEHNHLTLHFVDYLIPHFLVSNPFVSSQIVDRMEVRYEALSDTQLGPYLASFYVRLDANWIVLSPRRWTALKRFAQSRPNMVSPNVLCGIGAVMALSSGIAMFYLWIGHWIRYFIAWILRT